MGIQLSQPGFPKLGTLGIMGQLKEILGGSSPSLGKKINKKIILGPRRVSGETL